MIAKDDARRALADVADLIRDQAFKIEDLQSRLRSAAERFRQYERLHLGKGHPDKAQRNAEMATLCEEGFAPATDLAG